MDDNEHLGIILDPTRDELITDFGRSTLTDRYLYKGETFQQMFARVAVAGSDNTEHAQRLYDYFSRHWVMPATPMLSNLGTNRGFPISCFLSEVADSREGIFDTYTENCFLASNGGGIGTYWGNVRAIGSKVGEVGETSGIIPFLKVMDSATLAISQGNLRRGSAAVYLDIHHPEIEEFLEIRKPTGGDINRKTLNLHHGILVTDKFMKAVEKGGQYGLMCPHTGNVVKRIDARSVWQKLLTTRIETGEPYIVFIDTVNKLIPNFHRKAGLEVKTSNLCSEITLPTNDERTAVCCLTQMNLEYYDEWKNAELVVEDIVRFADNVISLFISNSDEHMKKASFSASQERSIGIGVMGFHSYLQKLNIPFESAMAKSMNINISKHIAENCNKATVILANERGPCPDAARYGHMVRNANVTAVAPTASTSIISGGCSPSGEPWIANAFTHKTLSGSFVVRNKYLERILDNKDMNNKEVWKDIIINEGSVQHFDFLSDDEKEVFKTAFEIDQEWVVEHASVRQQFVDQSISTNIFLDSDIKKSQLHKLHFNAWKKGLKSLYYCRSKSIQRADKIGHNTEREIMEEEATTSFDSGCMGCE